jgi:hypothetical protein
VRRVWESEGEWEEWEGNKGDTLEEEGEVEAFYTTTANCYTVTHDLSTHIPASV